MLYWLQALSLASLGLIAVSMENFSISVFLDVCNIPSSPSPSPTPVIDKDRINVQPKNSNPGWKGLNGSSAGDALGHRKHPPQWEPLYDNNESACFWLGGVNSVKVHVDYGNCLVGTNSGVCGSLVTVALVTSIFYVVCYLGDIVLAYCCTVSRNREVSCHTPSFVGCTFLFLELLCTSVFAGVWFLCCYLISSGMSTIDDMISNPTCDGDPRTDFSPSDTTCVPKHHVELIMWTGFQYGYREYSTGRLAVPCATSIFLVSIL